MKTLFITNLSDKFCGFRNINDVSWQNCSGSGLDYPLNLLRELSKYTHVDVYSPPLRGHIETTPVPKQLENGVQFLPQSVAIPQTIDMAKLANGYDITIVYAESMFSYIENFEKCKTKKVLWFLSSPQQILLPIYKELWTRNCTDLILTVVDKAGVTEFGRKFAEIGKTKWLPLSVDGNRFRKHNLPKIADVCLLGNLNPVIYPLRLKAVNYLVKTKYRLFLQPYYGEEYVTAINSSRVFLTCSGTWKFPVMKYFEATACGTLLFADTPMDAEELGFKAGENFVSIDNYSDAMLQATLDHYFTHVAEAEKVAHAGEELIRKRHTNEVRAKELYRMLEQL